MASLYSGALALRLVPLLFSPLPFNIDGFPLAKIAQDIGTTGSWQISPTDVNSYNMKMPAYSLLWFSASALAGVDVLGALQFLMPSLLATVVLPAYLLAVKATRSRVAGFASGLFVAVFGSFLFLTSAAMKEAVGLVLLPTVVLLFAERADPRKRGLALLLLLLLPLVHHLTTFLALGMVSALVVLGQGRAIARHAFTWRGLLLDLVTGPVLALPAYAYYAAVHMTDLGLLSSADGLALFLAVVAILTVPLAAMVRPVHVRLGQGRARPAGRVVLVPAFVLVVLLANGRMNLFAGALGTQSALLGLLPAVAALMAPAVVGFQLVRRTTNRASDVVLAMLVAPTALVLFAFLRGLDPLSMTLVYRSFDFLDYGVAVLAGAGFALAWSHLRGSRTSQIALGAAFFGLLLATTPMAWNSQAVFGVDNVMTPAEFQALAVLAGFHPVSVTTDQRLADVGSLWFKLPVSSDLPYLLVDNTSLSGHDYALVLERWTTVGAQEHPAPNVVLTLAVLSSFLRGHRVVDAFGPAGDRIYVVAL